MRFMESKISPHAQSWCTRLIHAWESIQVELHGCYSTERLRALDEYSCHVTTTRTILVLVLTPLPCILAVIFADCIPLEPPDLGIRHSGGFWIRACFATWVYSYTILEQLRFFIPELPLTGWVTLALSIPIMVLTNTVTFVLAYTVGYPMPFTIQVLSIPWSMFMAGALWFRLGSYLRERPSTRRALLQFLLVMICQISLLIIYPAYNAVFYNLSSKAQALFALLLPVIKLVEKNVFFLFMRQMEDLRPEHVVFNVEVFNALFIACCMQNSNSIVTNFVLVGVDFTMACMALHDLDGVISKIHPLTLKMKIPPNQLREVALLLCRHDPRLESRATQKLMLQRIRESHASFQSGQLPRASRILHIPVVEETQVPVPQTRTWKLFPICIARETPSIASIVPTVENGGNRRPNASVSRHTDTSTVVKTDETKTGHLRTTHQAESSPSTIASTIASRVTFPRRGVATAPAPVEAPHPSNVGLLSEDEQLSLLQNILQTLHLTEYMLLIEYVEVMIPIVYSIYLVVLFFLPNRTYYPQLRDMDEDKLRRTVGNVMMNAAFEFVSLQLLIAVLRRKLHLSPLTQLTFVLDRQWRMVQSKVVLWVVVTLQSTLYHLGADYSFKFAWLSKKHGSSHALSL